MSRPSPYPSRLRRPLRPSRRSVPIYRAHLRPPCLLRAPANPPRVVDPVSLDAGLAVETGVPRAGWPVLGVPAFGPVWGVLRVLLDGELLMTLDCVATRAIGVAAACAPVGVLTSCLRFGVCPDLPGC